MLFQLKKSRYRHSELWEFDNPDVIIEQSILAFPDCMMYAFPYRTGVYVFAPYKMDWFTVNGISLPYPKRKTDTLYGDIFDPMQGAYWPLRYVVWFGEAMKLLNKKETDPWTLDWLRTQTAQLVSVYRKTLRNSADEVISEIPWV